jgi:folate-dependent phosphoribosylglycinamide formyltransferase PurN
MKRRWIAMFSQTGSEVAALAKHLGKWPDVIITNNTDRNKWCKQLQELELRQKGKVYGGGTNIKVVSSIEARTSNFLHGIEGAKTALVTLHGWLRIIPKDICEQYEIVNGHPGLINVHPELKGKDPQVRAYEAGHATIGSVVHKVTPVVDDGEILEWTATYQDESDNIDDVFAKFQHTSLSSWIKFFEKDEYAI